MGRGVCTGDSGAWALNFWWNMQGFLPEVFWGQLRVISLDFLPIVTNRVTQGSAPAPSSPCLPTFPFPMARKKWWKWRRDI